MSTNWRWVDEDQTTVTCGDGRYIPANPDNLDYAALVAAGTTIAPVAVPALTDSDVTREYERRLLAILEARDLAHAAYIRADDTDELMSLQAMSSRTTEQETRRGELLARRASIETLIAAYNAMASPPPADFTADSYWS
tara:strand:- start:6611 stop:7027 length:417 start_codon:yes stop_codon:yes gene_type:complete